MPRQATLADVAAAADVSIATASRVLNGDGRQVSEKLRTRIHAAAERLDYVPNAHAQALMRVDTRSVGVLAFDVGNPFFTEIIEGIMGVAAGADRLVTIGNVSRDPATEIRYVDLLRSQRVGAVILTGSGRVDPDPVTRLQTRLDAFRATGGRVALIGRHEVEGNRVVPDNQGGAAAAARALLEFGHTELGVIAGPADMTVTVDRLAGFLGQCAAAGHPVAPERVVPGLFTREGGAAAMRTLLDVAPLDHRGLLPVGRHGARGVGRAARARGRGPAPHVAHRLRRHLAGGRAHAGAVDGPRAAEGDGGRRDADAPRAERRRAEDRAVRGATASPGDDGSRALTGMLTN